MGQLQVQEQEQYHKMKGIAIQLEVDINAQQVLRPVFKVIRNADGKIVNGLNIGNTQAQNEALILAANPGEFKNSITLGVGLSNAILGDTDDMISYRYAVRRNYQMEGLELKKLELFDVSKVKIEAQYK